MNPFIALRKNSVVHIGHVLGFYGIKTEGRYLLVNIRFGIFKTLSVVSSENHKKPFFICFHYQFRA